MMAMAQQYAHPGGMPGQGLPHGHPMGDPRDPRNSHGMPPGQPGLNQMQMSMAGNPQVVQGNMMGGMPQMGQHPHMSQQVANQLAIQNAQMNGAMASMQNMNPAMRQQMIMRQQAVMANSGNQGMMMNPGQHVMMPNGMGGPMTRVPLPAHLQNQIPGAGHPHPGHMSQQQQMLAAQQQHQQQQQQIQAAQQAAQQHIQQQQQQQMAMQQQGSQAGPSPAPSAAAQPLRPPSQVQNRPEQLGPPPTSQPQPPQPQPTPVQQQQQPPQPQQPTPQQQQQHALQQQQQQQQQQQAQQQQAQQQQAQQQQQQQQNQQANQGQQPGPQSQQPSQQGQPQINVPHSNDGNLTMSQRMQIMQYTAQQRNRQGSGSQGVCVLTLLQFADDLSSARETDQSVELSFWQSFVSRFFAVDGSLRHQLLHANDNSTKAYELSGPPVPWYYYTFFKNGVERMELNVEKATETDLSLPHGGHVVKSERTTFTFYYGNTHQVVSVGRLQVHFDAQGKIKLFDFKAEENQEFINRSELVPDSPDQKAGTSSPKLNKKQQQQRKSTMSQSLMTALERRPVGEWGIPKQVMQLLEVSEGLISMRHLFSHHAANPSLTATETLKAVLQNFEQQSINSQHGADGQSGGLGPQGFPGGPPNQRTPGAGAQFASPAPNAHLALPGGNMTASPAMMNHGLPGQGGIPMVPNPSQGGSGNPSANASPSVTGHGKKRRQSQVKTEEDGDKSKPSPRMPNGPSKRMKAQG